MARRAEGTNRAYFVSPYDLLTMIRHSPVVELSRAIAVAQLAGPEPGLEEIHAIADRDRLAACPFYSVALGELELRRGRREIAREHFQAAVALARNPMERRFLEQRVWANEVRHQVFRIVKLFDFSGDTTLAIGIFRRVTAVP